MFNFDEGATETKKLVIMVTCVIRHTVLAKLTPTILRNMCRFVFRHKADADCFFG